MRSTPLGLFPSNRLDDHAMVAPTSAMLAHTLPHLRYFPYRTTRTRFNLKTPSFISSMESSSSSTSNAEQASPDPLVQYVVLRRDLIDSWPLGSVVTQGCHASVAAIWAHKDDPHTHQYCFHLDSMHKVTLEVKGEPQILNLMEKLKENGIDHKLWIEQPENIPTCLATKPYPKSIVSSYFRRLKLCK